MAIIAPQKLGTSPKTGPKIGAIDPLHALRIGVFYIVRTLMMATYHHKDGDFEMTVITHGKPDPHMAAQAILPWVMAAIERDRALKQNAPSQSTVKKLIKS
jgi:hypothetical protein